MSITVHCPHDKVELVLVPDEKSPDGLLKCPKCGCTFRVCLAIFDKDCYAKMHSMDFALVVPEKKKKRKRSKKKKEDHGFPDFGSPIETPNILGI